MFSHIGIIPRDAMNQLNLSVERPKNVLLWFTPFLHKLNNISSAFISINTEKFSKNR